MTRAEPQLIIPFAKPSGVTSFTSLWQVKRALGTKKVGHTGTLDSFADGLLVLLSGKLTKLAPYITGFDKTYRALFYFGKETDTLDPGGSVIAEKPFPAYAGFLSAVRRLTGTIEQEPPAYSAVKRDGQRLSDRMRRGEAVTVPSRTVTIYENIVETVFFADGTIKSTEAPAAIDAAHMIAGSCAQYAAHSDTTDASATSDGDSSKVAGALLRVRCSKGTYIRSLVRDIARDCGSAAYVYALRRTAVGPFTLERAAGAAALQPFGRNAALPTAPYSVTDDAIKQASLPLNETLARAMHFQAATLKEQYYAAFMNGKPIGGHWFTNAQPLSDGGTVAVFYEGCCVGLMTKNGNRFHYEAVFSHEVGAYGNYLLGRFS